MSNPIKKFLKSLLLRVPAQEQVIFARHLAVMSKAGLPLLDSLKMIQKETRSKALLKIMGEVIIDVSNGQFLAASLEKFKDIFGNLFINIIRVGESAGILAENLNYLADELKKKQELRRKVVGALIYPAVVLVATFGITGLLTVFIFPKILPVFKSLNVKLPLTTQILIAFSDLLTNYGPMVILSLAILVIALWLILKLEKVRFYFHYLLLRLPIFGAVVKDLNLANFSRTLGLTLKSGVKIVEAVSITAESLSNLVYKKELLKLTDEVRKGGELSAYFEKKRFLFPAILSSMIAVGETAGNLSETLLYLSEFYESEVDGITKNLSNVLEPILMVIMGIIVGFVAIAIITPIYEVSRTVSR